MDKKKKQVIIDDIMSREYPLGDVDKKELATRIAYDYLRSSNQEDYEEVVKEVTQDFYVKVIKRHIEELMDEEHQDPSIDDGWEYFPYPDSTDFLTDYGKRHKAFMDREGLDMWDFIKFSHAYMQEHPKAIASTIRGEVEILIYPKEDGVIRRFWDKLDHTHKVEVINEFGYFDLEENTIEELETNGFSIFVDMSYWTLNIIPDVEAIFDELDRIFKEKQAKEAK